MYKYRTKSDSKLNSYLFVLISNVFQKTGEVLPEKLSIFGYRIFKQTVGTPVGSHAPPFMDMCFL